MTLISVLFFFLILFARAAPGGTETFGELNLGEQYFEGDIILTENQKHAVQALWQDDKVQNRDLMKGFRELWPNNTVPYSTAKGLRKYKVSRNDCSFGEKKRKTQRKTNNNSSSAGDKRLICSIQKLFSTVTLFTQVYFKWVSVTNTNGFHLSRGVGVAILLVPLC